jgi:HEAT repeat protein
LRATTAAEGLILAFFVAAASPASAQTPGVATTSIPGPVSMGADPALPTPLPTTNGLLAHVGLGTAIALMRSTDADERLRGLERIAATGTPQSLSLLVRAAESRGGPSLDPRLPAEGIARTDPRALLVVVRALATGIESDTARAALAGIVAGPPPTFSTRASPSSRDPAQDEIEAAARVLLARREAALALAGSGDALAVEALVTLARSSGPGQGPALEALTAVPPVAPSVFAGVPLTTPSMIALATQVFDLRTLDALLGVLRTGEPPLRAAALSALGAFGDARVIDAARAALHDGDPRVRIGATDALVHLGAPDAAKAVEALVADDKTAASGLALAELLSDDGIVKAAAARAAASADTALRRAAVAALGRQKGALAAFALAALVSDPALESSVAAALARSPSRAAMGVIEAMARIASSRRIAARAYFVRRYTRGERSATLDALLAALSGSANPTDRAVAIEAQVALGETSPSRGLSDGDPRVRRAAAMGALGVTGRSGTSEAARIHDALVRHVAMEPDEPTRVTLCAGLVDGDPSAVLSTLDLIDRALGGGADAPLAALAISRRTEQAPAPVVDNLLASRDSVLRAHAALGLGESGAPDAVGRLSRAYLWEADVDVRRALVQALGVAAGFRSGEGRATLGLAASLDPDAITRGAARRALSGTPDSASPAVREVAWIKLSPAESGALPRNETALLIRSDGLAVPIAFDDDGYALVAGLPPGGLRLRLAPRLPTYSPLPP